MVGHWVLGPTSPIVGRGIPIGGVSRGDVSVVAVHLGVKRFEEPRAPQNRCNNQANRPAQDEQERHEDHAHQLVSMPIAMQCSLYISVTKSAKMKSCFSSRCFRLSRRMHRSL